MISNAIISVCDKTGVVELAKSLQELRVNLYSTGGTYQKLTENKIPVKKIEDYIQFPEILGGRVKSLHPGIHAGILARRDQDSDLKDIQEHDIITFDLVCVNLYPFEEYIRKTDPQDWQKNHIFSEAIEMIDIGGPTMVRAAAKNHAFVYVLTNPGQYKDFLTHLRQGEPSLEYRKKLAADAFNLTAGYDTMIDHFFAQALSLQDRERLNLSLSKKQKLRYGENPHQKSSFYAPVQQIEQSWEQLHGKELSYNNLLDIDSALLVSEDFDEPSCIIFKHTNPCGAASHDDQIISLANAISADPTSCFGGIVLFNETVLSLTAEKLNTIFFEIIIATDFEKKALDILKQKKTCGCLGTKLKKRPIKTKMKFV